MDIELAKNPLAELSASRKIILLFLFCLSQFLDVFNISALFSAIPVIATSIGLNDSQSVWLNSAYQLSFAALLLIGGRMSDIYNPKIVFLSGVYLIGFLSLGIGFARNHIAILALRAFSGIDPVVQAKAVGAFAGSGALGNVLGVIIGALIISHGTWPWIFYVAATLALLIAITCTFFIPQSDGPQNKYTLWKQFQRLDVSGGSLLIAAMVLFIFAVTSGSTDGWKTATVLVPLFLSVLLFGSFFVWEARIPQDQASLPPHLWSYPNFASLAILALLPYAWWTIVYSIFAWYWQEVQSWSAINSGVHFLPLGLFAAPSIAFSNVLQQKFDTKLILLGGLFLMVVGTVFLPFADYPSHYWSITFPGFMLGTAGTAVVFSTTNIAMFAATPPKMAGTVGAVFNCALQLGSAVFTSVATSVQTSVQPSLTSFKGRGAAFEFLIAFIVLQIISVLVFVRKTGGVSDSGIPFEDPSGHASSTEMALQDAK